MKNVIRIASVFLLTATWFLATGAVVNVYSYPVLHDDPVSLHASVAPGISAKLFSNATQAEGEVSNCNNFSVTSYKDPYSAPGAVNKAIEQLLQVAFAQYARHSRDFPVHSRKSDMLFPFQYFW